MRFPVIARTRDQLDVMANPSSYGQPEALPWVLYDSQTYVSAATTALTFFQSPNADPSLSNMQSGGQLVDPIYFQLFAIYLDVLGRPQELTAAPPTAVGLLDDIAQLMVTGRGIWQFSLQDKIMGPFPVSFLHGSGYAKGIASQSESSAAAPSANRFEAGMAGDPFTTFYFNGSVIIKPKVGWNIKLSWPAALALTGDVILRLSLAGVWFRAVV